MSPSAPSSAPAPRRSRGRTALRWTARTVAGVAALLVVGAGAVYGLSERRIRARFEIPEHPLVVRDDAATIARGQHLATTRGCLDCHGANLGGAVVAEDPMIGRLAGSNLTRGRAAGPLTPRDWERAVRHAVRRDGSGLLFMPSHEFTGLADDDLAAIVAWANTLPPVTREAPATVPGPLMRALALAGQVALVPAERIDHAKAHLARVDPAPTAEYGAYIAAGCVGCHGDKLSGGPIPGTPPDWKPAANITPAGIGSWSEADFVRAMREGKRPDGSEIGAPMPIAMTKHMTDVELKAVYAYLKTVPAVPYGHR